MKNLLFKILEEKNEKNIFSLISQPKKDECVLWSDILESFHMFLPHKSIDKKYFWGNDLSILKRFGFDIDHEDSFGNTLLFHLYSKQQHNKYLSFEIKDILKRTKKLYHINNMGENILFFMANNLNNVSWENANDFITGNNLISFIKQHPKLDVKKCNNFNRNLINQSLLNMSFPDTLFDYLIDQGLSTNHIDKDGYNLVNFFPLLNFTDNIANKFLQLCEDNDINYYNKHKQSCVSTLISFVSSENNNNNEKTHIKWLEFIFANIIEGTIPITDKQKLIKTLDCNFDKYSFEAKKIIPLQKKTIGYLKYQILNEKFPQKNIQEKKFKI